MGSKKLAWCLRSRMRSGKCVPLPPKSRLAHHPIAYQSSMACGGSPSPLTGQGRFPSDMRDSLRTTLGHGGVTLTSLSMDSTLGKEKRLGLLPGRLRRCKGSLSPGDRRILHSTLQRRQQFWLDAARQFPAGNLCGPARSLHEVSGVDASASLQERDVEEISNLGTYSSHARRSRRTGSANIVANGDSHGTGSECRWSEYAQGSLHPLDGQRGVAVHGSMERQR